MNARKREREMDSAISKMYVEEIGQLFNRGHDFVIAMPSHTSTKQLLDRVRRKSKGSEMVKVLSFFLYIDLSIQQLQVAECSSSASIKCWELDTDLSNNRQSKCL